MKAKNFLKSTRLRENLTNLFTEVLKPWNGTNTSTALRLLSVKVEIAGALERDSTMQYYMDTISPFLKSLAYNEGKHNSSEENVAGNSTPIISLL